LKRVAKANFAARITAPRQRRKDNAIMGNHVDEKRSMLIRSGVSMAYEDHWFGEPWMVPDTVVMVHGNAESSRDWTCWVPSIARHYRVIRAQFICNGTERSRGVFALKGSKPWNKTP
jgi:pimeloyl-ACP methyl ester carboxylesterase